jgi:rubrerythrin
MTKQTEALKMAHKSFMQLNERHPRKDNGNGYFDEEIQACKEALEQEERTQRTMHCGTADAFIAMDDDHKRRWFVQSLRESKRRKELEDILEQPAQEPIHNCPNCNSLFTTEIHSIPTPSWQGLSDDEINKIVQTVSDDMYPWKGNMLIGKIIRAIEQASRIKNGY